MLPVKSYFALQFILLKRQMSDFGLNPILGFLLLLIGFIGLSVFLFSKTNFASYLYVLIALSIVSRNGLESKNNFLKFTYNKVDYSTIRIVETLIVVFPFLCFLVFKWDIKAALLLISLSSIFTCFDWGVRASMTIPTPFSKRPFEFLVGFRKWFFGFILAYFLTTMSVLSHNFHLGLFSLSFIFLICLSFYGTPEEKFYVWVYSISPNLFLLEKIKTSFIFTTALILPSIITLFIFFWPAFYEMGGIVVLGYLYLVTIILAKYSDYPNQINLPQGILIGLSILLPPFLLLLIPFFYYQSYKRLKETLA